VTKPVASFDFRGHAVRRLTYRGQIAFIAREVGTALGYEEGGRRFVGQITTEWAGEIRQDVHWFRVKGAELREIKAVLRVGTDAGPTDEPPVHSEGPGLDTGAVPSGAPAVPSQDALLRTPELVLLTEEGVTLALLQSRRPLAVEFRLWLASEVVPAIVRTGKYDPAPAAPRRRLSREASAVRRLVDASIAVGRYDIGAALLLQAHQILTGPEGRFVPAPPKLPRNNVLMVGLLQRGLLVGEERRALLAPVWDQEVWKPGEKAVLAVLLDLAGDARRVMGRTHAEIGETADLTKRAVTAALGVLEQAGVIMVERSPVRGPSTYTVQLEALAGWSGKTRPTEWP
jgi:prophage antirepressor-like protein